LALDRNTRDSQDTLCILPYRGILPTDESDSSLVRLSEQSMEAVHSYFKSNCLKYKVSRDHPECRSALYYVLFVNSQHI